MNTLLILFYCLILFALGVYVGMQAEQQYQIKLRAKFRAMHGPTIEEAMYRDGWKI
jgi:hypothetical protein